jgi:hypothetical protein
LFLEIAFVRLKNNLSTVFAAVRVENVSSISIVGLEKGRKN